MYHHFKMDEQNGDCFEHHDTLNLFPPLSSSDTDHDCLKDFLLDPPSRLDQSMSDYCFDNGLQNIPTNQQQSLMPMNMNSGLSSMGLASHGMAPGMGMALPGGPGMPMSPMTQGMGMSQNMSITSSQGMPIPTPQSMPIPSPQSMHVPSPQGMHVPSPQGMHMSHVPSPQGMLMSHVPSPQGMHMSHVPSPQGIPMPHVPSPQGMHMPSPQGIPMPSPQAMAIHSPQGHMAMSSQGMAMPLGSPMTHVMPLPNLPMGPGPGMSMAGSSGLPMPSNSCMPLSPSTGLPMQNQVLPMSSPSPMSAGGSRMSPAVLTRSPIPLPSGPPLPRPLMNLPGCTSEVSMMHSYQPGPHIPQTPSPARAIHHAVDFRSPGHCDSAVPSASDDGGAAPECDKNGEWSPNDSVRTGESQEEQEPGTSERTVSSDCVSSETLCSPETAEGTSEHAEEKRVKVETRGRKRKTKDKEPRKRKSPTTNTIATYQSQISPDQNGIKIRIKKSMTVAPLKQTRKRRSKSKVTELEEYVEPAEQTAWGDRLPKVVLSNVFYMVTKIEGCVPFLVRMSRVCRLWRDVAVSPHLWYHIDLASTWCRDRVKNDRTFQWLCENRLAQVQELNLGGWSFTGIPSVLDKMASSCIKLQGLGLSGLQGLSLDNIKFLVSNCPHLERLDLSSINPELNSPRSAVSTASVLYLAETMAERLTHLILANNKLAGVPQIISAIAAHCPNLQVLDLANVRTVAQTTAYIHIEKLQEGCPSLRVLRLTNSQLALSPVSFNDQATSLGFPHLEELSVAGVVEGLSSQPFVDDEALQRIIKSSKKLRLLDVRGCNRVSDSSLVRVPAWDLEHIFLSGCYVTRLNDSGLELIVKKWSHSLVEVDLAWSTATEPLDAAVTALADQGETSRLRTLDLCGSSVSLEPVRAVLTKCPLLASINLSSCRALPRGMKRLYQGVPLVQLRCSMLNDGPPADQ